MNNRQAGRRRGRGGQRAQGGGGNPGRDNGNRIDNRARGNAAQLLEKYKNLASDAQRQGDRVNFEYFSQFADHYFRVLNESRVRFEENRRQRDDESDDEEFDGFDESDTGEERHQFREERSRDDRPQREERSQREDRPQREDRSQREERGQREDRPQREERQPRAERDDRAPRADRPARGERRRDIGGDDRAQVAEPAAEAGAEALAEPVLAYGLEGEPAAEPRPRRRLTRARRDAAPVADAPASDHGDDAPVAAVALDADRLPPALNANADGGERPRRRRRVRTEDEAVPPAA